MTTFEHALLGINGALACGLHRRFSWRLVPLAGIAAVAPDWDGIPMLVDMARFENGHRVWGHNLFACAILAMFLVELDRRLNYTGWIANAFRKSNQKAHDAEGRIAEQNEFEWPVWTTTAVLAALSQIPADVVVSGGKGLTDWPLKPLWPVSDFEVVYPMIPWGNIGVTVIFAVAMIGQAKYPARVQRIAITALATMTAYILLWSWM